VRFAVDRPLPRDLQWPRGGPDTVTSLRSIGRYFFQRPIYFASTDGGCADLADGDDDGLEAESQDTGSECRRCREHGYIERGVDDEGHEAEESPSNKGAVRAREEALELQGVQRLSARSLAPYMQGVRWGINLRARPYAL
jgi:hypothetical protein